MSYTVTFSLALGAGHSGLASTLGARTVTWNGSGYTVADAVAPGSRVSERGTGTGSYLFTFDGLDEGFRGAVEFGIYSAGPPATLTSVLAVVAINPQEEALLSQAVAELSSLPGSSPTVAEALSLLYMALRNKMVTQTGQLTFSKADGSTLATATLTDSAGTFTRERMS